MFIDVSDISIFCYQLSRSDFTNPLDSWHVVGRVAAYGQDIYHLFRCMDAIFRTYLFGIDDFIVASSLAWLELTDVVRYELAVILIRSHHEYLEALFPASFGHGADHVIRFESLYHQDRESHRLAKFAERFERIYYELRSLISGSFVFRIHFMSECSPRRIKGDCQMCGLFLVNEFEYVFCESEQDGHVCSL